MEGGSALWEAQVKDEPEYGVDVSVCIKIEPDVDGDQLLNPEAECVQPKLECVEPETLWKHEGLYADHEVKEELVLGPELLQRLCADKSCAPPYCEVADTSSSEKEIKPQWDVTVDVERTTAVDTYMCDWCGNLFKKKHALIRHIKAHLQENPKIIPRSNKKLFFCEICNKQFSQSGHYNRHVLTHAGGKSHTCDICNKRFAREDSLRIHARIHSGQRPYACQFCGKRFSQSHNLTRHVRVHTGEKPYVCDICNKSCSQSGDLKTHKRTHGAGNAPYSCDCGCGRTFNKRAGWLRHKRGRRRKNARDAAKKA